jgi:predicted dehydrogenase
VDLDPQRVALAEEMGAEAVIRDQAEQAAQSFSDGKGFDSVLICADTPASDPVELAGTIARDRACVIAVGAVGLELPRKIYFEKELTFINSRSYGPGRYDTAYEEKGQDYPIGYVRWTEGRNLNAFVDLLSSGRLNVKALITHRYTIDRAPEAYELITGKKGEPFLGVLLKYPKTAEELGTETEAKEGRTPPPIKHEVLPVQSKIDSVNLGVLGAGNFSTAVMLPILHKIPNLEFVGITSASGMNAQHAANRYNFQYAESDETKIIADPTINTIAIFTRHNLHTRQVLASLKAGKHVFCEKPLALNQEELNEIAGVLDNIPTSPTPTRYPLLMVGFNRRFAPLAQKLKDFLVDTKEPLVAHYRVNAGYIPLNHWLHDPEQGGGRIIGEGCHFIDFLAFLVGATPSEVSAQALPDAGRYFQDNVVITLSFPDGSIGTLSYLANGDKAFPKEQVEVFCGGRVAVLDDYRSLTTVSNGKRRVERSRLRQNKGHFGEWEAFTQSILTGGEPPIPYDQIFGVTRTTFATMEALRSGTKVKIS